MNSLEIMEPSACTWCGIARRGHGRQYADAVGYHSWEQPTDEQIKARMQARRLALAVAREGALPVPVGPEPQDVDEQLIGANLSLWEEEQETARLRLALKSAQRGRREARSRVAELEARLGEYERPADEDPITYTLTAEADGITRRNVPLQVLRADADRGLLAEQSHQLDPADSVFAAMACACPEACSCDADYPGWAAGLAAAEGAGR